MPQLALVLLLVVVTFAGGLFWPAIWAFGLRILFRSMPEAREAFVGNGSWIRFSRRFGRAYAIASFALAFSWFITAISIAPNTEFGAWLIFGPTILFFLIGVLLGGLVVLRWVVDEP